jgi:cephalosporin hydroxylase
MNPVEEFEREKNERIAGYGSDEVFRVASRNWLEMSMAKKYVYNFSWMDRPIIQYPQDIVAMQELIWQVRPDVIVETGIAHGGSLVLSASVLALLDYADAVERGEVLDPRVRKRKVIGVDIEIREHNRAAIQSHPMSSGISMIQGSSVDANTIQQVYDLVGDSERVLVCLDSNHTHDHVLQELEAYAPLTSIGSYCVVFDTFVEDTHTDLFPDRPWGKGNNPKTAAAAYLKALDTEGREAKDGKPMRFEIDHEMENKLQITVAPKGFLRRLG